EVRVGDLGIEDPNDDVAIVAAHELDRVARLDGRVAGLIGGDDALAVDVSEIRDARQERACVARSLRGSAQPPLAADDRIEAAPGMRPGAVTPVGRRLAIDRIDPPDFACRAGLSTARIDLSRPDAAAERGGKTKKSEDQRARPLVQSHGAIS